MTTEHTSVADAQDSSSTTHATKPRRPAALVLLPVVLFGVLAVFFAYALVTGDPSRLPSVLVGKAPPEFALPAVDELVTDGKPVPGLSNTDLSEAGVSIVNVWASWCGPCHQEHPYLVQLAERSGVPLFGINYKDKVPDARRFLGRYGNPFQRVGVDASGRTAIDFGVYGVPETYLIDRSGNIAYRHVGPVLPDNLDNVLLPLVEKLKTAPDPAPASGSKSGT